ncbi:MAG: serine/threonine-protein kinase [Candidatus Obscuribacterales bacterium]|nr:serine/threonine-protein kinase [Candidatus Obscuribacterales bacterium]
MAAEKNNEPSDVEEIDANPSAAGAPESTATAAEPKAPALDVKSLAPSDDEPSSANKSMKDEMEDTLVGTTVVGRYEVQQCLSKQPASSLYKARHLLMDRPVAIRLLTATDIQSLKRFQVEAKVASSLNHPNIITVLDFGVSNGRPYLVTDYLEGKTLADLLKQHGKLSYARTLDIFSQVCDAVTYAHKQDLLIRCLKPSQIFVYDTPDYKDFVKVVEFGISERYLEDGEEVRNLANKAVINGDPHYLSPEAVLSVKLDAKSDVFTIGCVMYEALVGRPPSQGKSAHEVMHRQLTKVPQAVREASGCGDIPEAVERVVMRAIEKDPDQRFPSMEALWTDIEVYKHGANQLKRSQQKRGHSSARDPALTKKRILRVLGLSISLFLGVVLGLAIEPLKESLFLGQQKKGPERTSWQEFNQKGEEAFHSGNYHEAEALFGQALAKSGGFEPDDPRIAETLNNLGNLYFNLDLYPEAENAIKRALAIREKAGGPNSLTVADSLNDLGMIYLTEGKTQEAKKLIQRALGIREKALKPDEEDIASSMQAMASIYHKEGKLKDSMAALKRALYIRKRALGTEHLDVATTYNSLGIQHQMAGENDDARQCYEHAKQIIEELYGDTHPAMADSLVGIATLDFVEGNTNRSEQEFNKALDVRETALGDESFRVAEVLSCLAILKEQTGKLKEAEDLLRRAIAIDEQAVGANNPETLRVNNNLVRILKKLGKKEEARRLEKRVVQGKKAALNGNTKSGKDRSAPKSANMMKNGQLAEEGNSSEE